MYLLPNTPLLFSASLALTVTCHAATMSRVQQTLASLRSAHHGVSMLIVLAGAHVAAGLFLRELPAGASQISDPGLRNLILMVFRFFDLMVLRDPGLQLLIAMVILVVLVWALLGHPIGRFLDATGALLCLRCLLQFLLLNLLLLARLKVGGLLLTQVVLFVPVIVTAFSWLFWRLDQGARSRGRLHLRFDEGFSDGSALDYFYASWMSLLKFEPSGATPTTPLMKVLVLVQGVAMMDLVVLTLSRAIGLASGGG